MHTGYHFLSVIKIYCDSWDSTLTVDSYSYWQSFKNKYYIISAQNLS